MSTPNASTPCSARSPVTVIGIARLDLPVLPAHGGTVATRRTRPVQRTASARAHASAAGWHWIHLDARRYRSAGVRAARDQAGWRTESVSARRAVATCSRAAVRGSSSSAHADGQKRGTPTRAPGRGRRSRLLPRRSGATIRRRSCGFSPRRSRRGAAGRCRLAADAHPRSPGDPLGLPTLSESKSRRLVA